VSIADATSGTGTGLGGEVIRPGDPGYDDARVVHNAMIDKRPAVIVRCGSTDDIVAALDYAQRSNLTIAVRGGGHNGPGFGTVDDGIVIDLSRLNRVDVDADARTVRVQGGATWGQVDAATHRYGLATPSGIIATTGVGGLTLGGGHGYLTRKYGLTIDNLLEAEVVLADGVASP
jgi:FAD/FMN-containing dehydrogenase